LTLGSGEFRMLAISLTRWQFAEKTVKDVTATRLLSIGVALAKKGRIRKGGRQI